VNTGEWRLWKIVGRLLESPGEWGIIEESWIYKLPLDPSTLSFHLALNPSTLGGRPYTNLDGQGDKTDTRSQMEDVAPEDYGL